MGLSNPGQAGAGTRWPRLSKRSIQCSQLSGVSHSPWISTTVWDGLGESVVTAGSFLCVGRRAAGGPARLRTVVRSWIAVIAEGGLAREELGVGQRPLLEGARRAPEDLLDRWPHRGLVDGPVHEEAEERIHVLGW